MLRKSQDDIHMDLLANLEEVGQEFRISRDAELSIHGAPEGGEFLSGWVTSLFVIL